MGRRGGGSPGSCANRWGVGGGDRLAVAPTGGAQGGRLAWQLRRGGGRRGVGLPGSCAARGGGRRRRRVGERGGFPGSFVKRWGTGRMGWGEGVHAGRATCECGGEGLHVCVKGGGLHVCGGERATCVCGGERAACVYAGGRSPARKVG